VLGVAGLILPFQAVAQSVELKLHTALGNDCEFKDIETGSLVVSNDGKVLEGNAVQLTLPWNTKGVQLQAEKQVQSSPSSVSLEDSADKDYVRATVEYKTDGPGNSPDVSETIEVNNAGNPSAITQKRGNVWQIIGKSDLTVKMSNVPFGGRRLQSEDQVLLFPDGQLTLDPEGETVSFRPLIEQLPSGWVHCLVSAGSRQKRKNSLIGEFSELAGSTTVRWGVAEIITLGVGLIHDQGTQSWGELFFRPLNLPLDLAIAGVFGKDLETNINYQPTSTLRFNFNSDRISSDLRTSWQMLPNLKVSGHWDSEQGTEFRINSRFRQSFNRSTRIEVTLDDTNEMQWQVRQQWGNLELSYEQNNSSTSTEISYEFANDFRTNQENRLIVDYVTRQFNESQQLATLSWEYRSGKRDVTGEPLWDIELGYRIGSQGQGIQADIETKILPGLRLRGRYEGVSLSSANSPFAHFKVELLKK
jgi:hypothetical protein